MTDPHSQIRAEVERRLAIARAATPGRWTNKGIGDYGWAVHFEGGQPRGVETDDDVQGRNDADFIALHDPADAIRRYEWDLDLLRRYDELNAESEGRLTHHEIIERYGQLELLRDLIADLAASLGLDTGAAS